MDPLQQEFFVRGQTLKTKNLHIEYADFDIGQPIAERALQPNQVLFLKQTLCAFLNNKARGGAIFLGVSRHSQAVGVRLGSIEREELQKFFNRKVFDAFSPKISLCDGILGIDFLPLSEDAPNSQDLCVVRIFADHDPSLGRLYSFSSSENEIVRNQCFLRHPGENVEIAGSELLQEVQERQGTSVAKKLLGLPEPAYFPQPPPKIVGDQNLRSGIPYSRSENRES